MRVAGVVTDDAGKGSEEHPANDWVLFLGRTVSAEPSGHVSLLSSSTATSITMTMHPTLYSSLKAGGMNQRHCQGVKLKEFSKNFRNPHSAVQGFVSPGNWVNRWLPWIIGQLEPSNGSGTKRDELLRSVPPHVHRSCG